MKLIYCRACGHVLSLTDERWRSCDCGKSGGRYLQDNLHAEVFGGAACVLLGFGNPSFRQARLEQPSSGAGVRFDAFVIPKKCPTVRRRRRPQKPTVT